MRILFTFIGGSGHFEPLVPIARAAEQAGHTVAFVSGHSLFPRVQAAGFEGFAIGKKRTDPQTRSELLPVDMQREEQDVRKHFAEDGARLRAAGILEVCAQWKPDLLVYDEMDFGSPIAAESLGLPHANVLVIAAGSFTRPELIAEPLNELRASYNLPADPELQMLSRYLVLSPAPPRYRNPNFPLPATAKAFRLITPISVDNQAPPAYTQAIPGAPTVYITLGTIFNMESGDLFSRLLAAVRDLPINIVFTTGDHLDPAEFGPQPAHIHLQRYIPQAEILPWCSAVICHGGSGSVIGALSHGLPLVLLAMGADQPLNAARGAALGVAISLDPLSATPEDIRTALLAILEEPQYRQAAQGLQAEIAALPTPAQMIPLLEQLVQQSSSK